MAATRNEYFYLAKLSEDLERSEDMMEHMEKVAREATREEEDLSAEERELLAGAYKIVLRDLLSSWRVISSIEKEEVDNGNHKYITSIRRYRERIESEFSSKCGDILRFIDTILIPIARGAESKVFYLMIKGDCYRYLVESKTGPDRRDAANNTLSCYKAAQEIAHAELEPRHLLRLSLALHLSGFYYDILYSSEKACTLAKQAYDDATADLASLIREETFDDTVFMLQLLYDNMAIWKSHMLALLLLNFLHDVRWRWKSVTRTNLPMGELRKDLIKTVGYVVLLVIHIPVSPFAYVLHFV